MTESDRLLLDRYVNDDDHEAFEQLVRRHSSMVFGVCLNVLSERQDAEDAFQLTFMTLSIKATKLGSYDSIGGWLHETSLRTCLTLRRNLGRKREVDMKTSPRVNESDHWVRITNEDESELIHKEIVGLPANYRDVIVLCHLEGKSRAQAADILNTTTASIKSTLTRARKLLRSRLLRRGIATTAALATVSGTHCAFAGTNSIVVESLIKSTLGSCTGAGGAAAGVANGLPSTLMQGKIASAIASLPTTALAMATGVMLLGLGTVSLWASNINSVYELPIPFSDAEMNRESFTLVALEVTSDSPQEDQEQEPELVDNNFILELPADGQVEAAVDKARIRFQRVIDDIAQSVELTEDQRQRLEIAAKGAVKQIEESRNDDEAEAADGLLNRREMEMALAQRSSLRRGEDINNEFWKNVIRKILTEEQQRDYEKHLKQRRTMAQNTRVAVFVSEADNELLLSAQAREKLTKFLSDRIVDTTELRRPGLPQNLAEEDLKMLGEILGDNKMDNWSRALELRLIRLIYE